MSSREAPQAYMGGNLLSGDIFQMLGLPSPGGFTTPLQTITDSVLGPGTYQNFQNAGTKKLLDVALKGVLGGKQPARRRGRPRKAAPAPKVCRHKYPNRCKCPKVEGAGIFDNVKDLFKAWEPEKIASKVGDLVIGNVVKKALGGSAIAARVNGFVSDPEIQKDIHKLFANAMTDMLVKHEQAGGAIPLDHPIFMEMGPAISGGRRMVAGSWTKWLNPLYLAKRALHATHIDRIINKIPIVGNVAAATGITGGKRPRGRPRKHPRKGGAAPVFDNDDDGERVGKKYHIEEWGIMEPRHKEDDERSNEGSVDGPMSKKERQAKYREQNREKLREKQRQYRESKKVKVI